ncbi:MAG: glutathione S-transferase family protein [Luminiphilus sp.]|nr:glutathione S-transferase family protein [Luminiphilus sp.]
MSEGSPILYHYDRSPYAEKVRLLFGLMDAEWRSVMVPIQPPRETLAILAGGYRRIPVMQLGADIYCDTRLICQELISDRPDLSGHPSLAATNLADRAESDVFFSAIRQVPMLKALIGLFSQLGLKGGVSFLADRGELTKGYAGASKTAKQARDIFGLFAQELESQLTESAWLAGDAPGIVDLRCYHPLFLALGFNALKREFLPEPIESWMSRLEAYGHGRRSELPDVAALGEARQSAPSVISENMKTHEAVGEWVTIQPNDYGRVPVTGVLVGADGSRWVLSRRSEDAGVTHIHFPKEGFDCHVID